MNLQDLVSPDSVICDADVNSKKRALELLANLLAKSSCVGDSLEIFHQLTEREKLGSTLTWAEALLYHMPEPACAIEPLELS